MEADSRRRAKKPKSGKSRHLGKYKNNCLSFTAFNSAPHIERIYNKTDLKDIVQYQAVDRRVVNSSYRKTFAPNLVGNTPFHNKEKVDPPKRKKKRNKERCIQLRYFYSKLSLSNWSYAFSNHDQYDVVINLTGIPLRRHRHHSLYLPDSRNNLSFPLFRQQAEEAVRVIQTAARAKQSVLICCNGGVNRSPAIAVAFAMLGARKKWKLEDAVAHIEAEKGCHNSWGTYYWHPWHSFTNPVFLRYLALLAVNNEEAD